MLTTDALDRTSRIDQANETIDGVEVIRLKNWSIGLRGRVNLSTPTSYSRVVQELVSRGVDIIHLHEIRTAEALLLPDTGVPIVVSPHGTLAQSTGRSRFKRIWDMLLGRRILNKIAYVHALTDYEAAESEEYWRASDVPFPGATVIPNGVPDTFPDEVAQIDKNMSQKRFDLFGLSPIILFMGRLSERKGVHLLIPAFAQIAGQPPGPHLLIAGADEGALDNLYNLTYDADLHVYVEFTGHLDGADRLAAYAAADVFVLPAEGEGLPIAVVEAMAARLPVLITPGCHLPGVESHDAGLIVEREVGALAAGLNRLLDDPDGCARMGANGLAWVHESFLWSRIADRMSELYERVAKSHSS